MIGGVASPYLDLSVFFWEHCEEGAKYPISQTISILSRKQCKEGEFRHSSEALARRLFPDTFLKRSKPTQLVVTAQRGCGSTVSRIVSLVDRVWKNAFLV